MYRRKDSFYQRAKRAGLRSRAAYKLEALNLQFRLIRSGDRVLDLGAWPGGWSQVAAEAVGPRGKVVGIDLASIKPFPSLPQVVLLKGDPSDPATIARLRECLAGPADVVLSDMSPKLSGVRARDAAAALALAELAVAIALAVLRPGGTLLLKIFMSDDLPPLLDRLRRLFDDLRVTRPEATRKGSAELYAIGKGFRSDSSR